MDRAVRNEADVQASQPQASQQARVPRENEDSGRSSHSFAPAEEGSRTPRGDGGQQVEAHDGPGAGEGLPRDARIRRTNEIRALLERGKRKRTKHLDVFLAPSPVSFSRLGLVVAKHGQRIVDRNLLKRRLREIGRRELLPALNGRGEAVDVLIRARREAYRAEYATLAQEVKEAVEGTW